uniref:Uncharacterized protein n=1 Tax=Arundo donax TaxID=35708 RepID=A0A0A9B292_ARUDO
MEKETSVLYKRKLFSSIPVMPIEQQSKKNFPFSST